MKLELPIAIGLLAIGGWLGLGGRWPFARPNQSDVQPTSTLPGDPTASAPPITTGFPAGDPTPPLQAKPANPLWQDPSKNRSIGVGQPFNTTIDDFSSDPVDRQDRPLAASGDYLHAATDPRAVEFLNRTSYQTANSQPFGTSLTLTSQMFGHSVSATGKYFQMGQGSHRSRLELQFQTDQQTSSCFQLCDGRFVYRLQTIDGRQQFEFVDLNRVAEQAGGAGAYSPTNWVATGGLASLFEQLRHSFNFGAPKSVRHDDESVTVLRGCWNETALAHALGNRSHLVLPADSRLRSRNQIRWANIPPQLPHGVEISFKDDPLLGRFPQQIRYLKFTAAQQATGLQTMPMLTIEFAAPTAIESLVEDMFVIRSSEIESIDTTDEYLGQVRSILAKRQAERNQQQQFQLK